MGGHYGSVQVRTTNRNAVKAAAESVTTTRKIRCLIGPEINGWVGIYPEGHGQDDTFGRDIAQQIDADVLHLLVHDDDVLAYWLWRKHELVDSYWSKPGYFGEEIRGEEEKRAGDPEQFRAIIGDKVDQLAKLLDREDEYTFEGERLDKLAKVLGMSNAVTEYDYLVSDERAGIKGWRKFDKVPPDPVKPKAPSRKSIRDKLKKAGLLLYSQEWKEFTQLLRGFQASNSFILGWANPWQNTAEFCRFSSPSYSPESLPFDPDIANANVQGNFAVIESGGMLRILDKSLSPWKLITEIPQIQDVGFSAISPNGQFIAHSNAVQIIVRKLPGGDQIYQLRRSRSGQMMFHPTEEWLAASGDTLGLFPVAGTPGARDFRVGGNARVAIENVIGIEEPGCIGFSKDGRFLWCGTNMGFRVYKWDSLTRERSQKPRWRLVLRDKLPSFWGKQITFVVEEVEGSSIVLGTFAGKLARFDLHSGDLYKLVDLPTGGRVENLLISSDGNALAVATQVRQGTGMKVVRAWEIWDYRKMRESAKFISRCEKRMPESPTQASQEDLFKWRSVSARSGKPRQ